MPQVRTTKQFLAAFKQARVDKGLTQDQLGELTGMSQKKIAMLENLTASPRLDLLLVIAAALELHIFIEIEKDT